jgi:glycosyltransferase involved in cell wall biosynthesis
MIVSIIIPVHDRAGLAEQAIASVALCAGPALSHEIIVVDDGSAPDEARRLANFCHCQPTCRYIRLQRNRGPQLARNEGLGAASGKYIKFLDSDDLLLPGALVKEVATIEGSSSDLVVSGWSRTSIDDVNLERVVSSNPMPYAGNPYDAILSGYGSPISAVLYRSTAIAEVRWDPRVPHPDDWFFLIKVLLREPRIATLEEPVFVWRDHGGPRASASSLSEYAHARFHILDHLYEVMRERQLLTPSRRQRLCNYLYRDIYVAHRFDLAHYRRILARLDEIDPGFFPDAVVEGQGIKRVLVRLLGYRRYVPLHNRLRRFWRQNEAG